MKDIEVNGGIVYIGVTPVCQINNVYRIKFNFEDVSIDCFDDNNNMIGCIYYKRIKEEIYYDDLTKSPSVTLAENGKIINKE